MSASVAVDKEERKDCAKRERKYQRADNNTGLHRVAMSELMWNSGCLARDSYATLVGKCRIVVAEDCVMDLVKDDCFVGERVECALVIDDDLDQLSLDNEDVLPADVDKGSPSNAELRSGIMVRTTVALKRP
jgi:hypothetical protein